MTVFLQWCWISRLQQPGSCNCITPSDFFNSEWLRSSQCLCQAKDHWHIVGGKSQQLTRKSNTGNISPRGHLYNTEQKFKYFYRQHCAPYTSCKITFIHQWRRIRNWKFFFHFTRTKSKSSLCVLTYVNLRIAACQNNRVIEWPRHMCSRTGKSHAMLASHTCSSWWRDSGRINSQFVNPA